MAGRWKGKKVAVLLGGISKEREISIRTGTAMADAFERLGYDVTRIDVKGGAELIAELQEKKPDVAVVALHGKFGEDGCVQGLLEMIRLPYTCAGVMASAVCMDKAVCSTIALELGLPCPEEDVFDADSDEARQFAAGPKIDLPLIVKPSREGSTINMTIVRDAGSLPGAIARAAESDSRIIVQRYIAGKEVTVGILAGRALPVLEIAPKSGFYDYRSKYTKGMTEYIVPARIDDAVAKRVQGWSTLICDELECEGMARVDFMVAPDGEAYFLEVNTVPGMTELSLVPKAAAHIGLSFEEVCEEVLDTARLKVEV